MRKIIPILIMIASLFTPIQSKAKPPAITWLGDWNLFLIAGQSNGVGVYTPLPTQSTSDDIQNFGVDHRWHVALEPCASQGDDSFVVDFTNYNAAAGYGITKRFGIEMRSLRPGLKVGMVNVARGGTSIAAWQKSGLSDETLYGAMIKRARAASTLGQLRGILWIQGEGDAIPANAATAAIYDTLLVQLVTDMRADLGAGVPVVIAGLGQNAYADTSYYPNWSLVDGKLYAASLVIPNSVYVSMSDILLTYGYDQYHRVHYNVPGYNTLAARLAGAMDGLMEP